MPLSAAPSPGAQFPASDLRSPMVLPPEHLTVRTEPWPVPVGLMRSSPALRSQPDDVADDDLWAEEDELQRNPCASLARVAVGLQLQGTPATFPALAAVALGAPVRKALDKLQQMASGDAKAFQYELAALIAKCAPTGSRPPRLRRLSDAVETSVSWLWSGWIPRGTLTIVQGDPGAGKTLVGLSLAACLSRGEQPGSGPAPTPCLPESTLLLMTEDTSGSAKARLRALRADNERVFFNDPMEEGRRFSLPSGIDWLEARINEHHARLVVLDPFADLLDLGLHLGDAQGMRAALLALTGLAVRTGVAILLVRHLTKGGSQRDRGVGSHALMAVARAVLQVDVSSLDPNRRVLTCLKTIGPKPPPVEFDVVAAAHGETRIEWLEAPGAEPARCAPGPRPLAREAAEEFLIVTLAYGARRVQEVQALAAARGIKTKTLRNAYEHLSIQTRRVGNVVSWELLPLQVPGAHVHAERSRMIRGM